MGKIKNLLYKVTSTTPGTDLQPKEVLSYSFAGFGQNLICALITSFLIVFLTDSVGINAQWLAYLFLVTRLFDAFNDPIMGSIVDKTKTKHGKLRPYLLYTPIPIGIFTVLCFIRFKSATPQQAFAYIAIIYVIWGIVYTIVDVPYWGLSTAMTSDTHKRGVLLTIARLLSTLGSGIVTVLIPIFLGAAQKSTINQISKGNETVQKFFADYTAFPERFGDLTNLSSLTPDHYKALSEAGITAQDAHAYVTSYKDILPDKYQIVFIIVAIVIVLFAVPTFFIGFKNTRERFHDNKENKKFKENIGLLFKNKPLLLIVLSGVLGGARMVFTASGIYFAKYTLQDTRIATALAVMVVPGGLLASVLTPALSKKFGKRNLFIYSHLIGGVFLLIAYFVGMSTFGRGTASLTVGAIALIISGIPFGFSNILSYAMISDTVDYLEYKTGQRAEGICFAMQTFISKVGMAFTAFIALIVISNELGYVPNQIKQTDAVLSNIWTASMLVPAISTILTAVPLFFYKLTEKEQARMVEAIKERKENEQSTVVDAEIVG